MAVDPNVAPEPLETYDTERGPVVILRLAAPGVFVDAFGMPADRPDARELRELLGDDEVEVVGTWTRWTEIGGWHAASGLPKPRERAVAPGSTYQIMCATLPSTEALTALSARGIGLRRREGFGALYMPPPAPVPPGYQWLLRIRVLRDVKGWHRLAGRLRDRLTRWPAEPDGDEKLLAAFRKYVDEQKCAALEAVLSIDDRALYREVLDRLEAR